MEKNGVNKDSRVVVIGGSAGSLAVLFELLPQLQPNIRYTIIIVLHRMNNIDSTLADLLASKCAVSLIEVEDKEPIMTNSIYLAPAGYHLLVEKDYIFSLDYSEKINFSRPSLDVTFESAALIFRKNLTGILLSGANDDGTAGLLAIKKYGGLAVVQDPRSAQMPMMPNHALATEDIDHMLDVGQIVRFLNNL